MGKAAYGSSDGARGEVAGKRGHEDAEGSGRNGNDGPSEGRRKRPFIFVYDLPPEYNSRMLQYKIHAWA